MAFPWLGFRCIFDRLEVAHDNDKSGRGKESTVLVDLEVT